MKRQRFSPEEYKAQLERQGGVCCVEGCTVSIGLEGEHTIPHWLSGKGKPDTLMCGACHKDKSRTDIKVIAKVKRIQKKRWGPKKVGGFRGWRRFDGSVVIRK